jgi:hypothetical protein
MASCRQTEGASTPDERAPLLAHEAVRYDAAASPGEDDLPSEPQKATSKTWQYVWRAFWLVVAILIIAVFVKGWMDADDVNVSGPIDLIQRWRLSSLCKHSLI